VHILNEVSNSVSISLVFTFQPSFFTLHIEILKKPMKNPIKPQKIHRVGFIKKPEFF